MKAQFALPCLLALLLVAGSIVCSSANAQTLRYRVTDLGTLGGPLANAFLLDPVPEIDCALDLSRDGRLDDDDLFVLRGALGTERDDADLNRDGKVDHLDLRQFLLRRARGECTEITPADSGSAEFSTIKMLPTQDPGSYSQPAPRRTGSH